MNENVYHRRALKFRAKQTFFRYRRPCVAAACLLIAFAVLAQAFILYTGGSLYYFTLDIRQFPMQTGVWKADPTIMTNLLAMADLGRLGDLGGMVFALRDDAMGLVLVLPMAWRQLINMFVIQGIVLLLTVPLQYGVLRQFRRVLEGRPERLRSLFAWYTDLRLAGKALCVQALLLLWRFLSSLLCAAPSILCLVAGYASPGGDFMLLLSLPLSIFGMLAGYGLYTALLPARFVLAQSPELSVGQAFSRGVQLLSGRRLDYFKLNLSFLPWQLLSKLLWSMPDLYVVPYVELSNYLFLEPPIEPEAPPVAL